MANILLEYFYQQITAENAPIQLQGLTLPNPKGNQQECPDISVEALNAILVGK